MFHGSIPALVTPFKDGAVDRDAFDSFVEWQIASRWCHAARPASRRR